MRESFQNVRPRSIFFFAVAIASAFCVARLALNEWDPTRFVYAGDTYSNRAMTPEGLYVFANDTGYDGQFFYRLAIKPFSGERTDLGITLDAPAYRHQRILYPLLAWLGSLGGRTELVPWTLIVVNVLGLGGIAYVGAMIARRAGRSSLTGLVFAAHPGFVVTLARDLSEIVAGFFLLLAIYFRNDRRALAALALTLGVLARESVALYALIAVAIGFLAWFKNRDRGKLIDLVGFAFPPLILLVVWQSILLNIWGELPGEVARRLLTLPFAGIASTALRWNVAGSVVEPVLKGIWLLAFGTFTIYVLRIARQSHPPMVETSGLFGYLFFSTLLGKQVWILVSAFTRALSEVFLIGTMIVVEDRSRSMKRFVVVVAALWSAHAVQRLF